MGAQTDTSAHATGQTGHAGGGYAPGHMAQAPWISLFATHQPQQAYALARKTLPSISRKTPGLQTRLQIVLGVCCWHAGKFDEALTWFEAANHRYFLGYTHMLAGRLQQAYQVWQPLLAQRPQHWCGILLGLVSKQLQQYPTFLGVRNNLEMDVYYLYIAGQMALLENYLSYHEALATINLEAYKLAGRSLHYAGAQHWAHFLLTEGQRLCPQDAELYYHLAQYWQATAQKTPPAQAEASGEKAPSSETRVQRCLDEAELMLKQCLMMQPHFVPAADLLATLRAQQLKNYSGNT
ncbi:MAG: hypothetical protein VKJ06_05760 [Vampirovibrionales bacterium]|nr:hypothetical protein [Vampirovibrionales bacterium]